MRHTWNRGRSTGLTQTDRAKLYFVLVEGWMTNEANLFLSISNMKLYHWMMTAEGESRVYYCTTLDYKLTQQFLVISFQRETPKKNYSSQNRYRDIIISIHSLSGFPWCRAKEKTNHGVNNLNNFVYTCRLYSITCCTSLINSVMPPHNPIFNWITTQTALHFDNRCSSSCLG